MKQSMKGLMRSLCLHIICIFLLFFFFCVNSPETPYQSKNSTIRLILESSDKKTDEFLISDTAGKTFRTGIVTYMPKFIDSIRISIFFNSSDLIDKDTLLRFDVESDTQWCSFVLDTAGARNLIARAYIQGNRIFSDTARISIFPKTKNISTNHAPQWGIDTIALSGSTGSIISFNLVDKYSDSDGDSVSFALAPGLPANDSIVHNAYSFTPSVNDTGIFLPRIIVKDFHGESDTLAIKLTITSLMQDNEPPIITYSDGPKNNERLVKPNDTLTYTIVDKSGVDSVFWTLNGVFSGILKKQVNDNYILPFELKKFNGNLIAIHACDGAKNKNCDSVIIKLNYNTKPGAVFPSSPGSKAIGVDTVPAFSWTGGDDPDGDTVVYRVLYGTAINSLNLKTNEVIAKTVTVLPADKLKLFARYFWQVLAFSKVYPDTTISPIDSFTTIGSGLFITSSPASIEIHEGDTLLLKVSAVGIPAPKTYQWYRNDTAIANATSATYKKINAVANDAGEYYVTVSNGVDKDTNSAKATVRVIHKFSLIYNGNGSAGGSGPVAIEGDSGSTVTISDKGSLAKTGYYFTGWNTLADGSGKTYVAGTKLVLDSPTSTLFAQWWKSQYSVSYSGNGSTGGMNPPQTNHFYGDQVMVATAGSLIKTGYTFYCWNTDSLGKGIDYASGATFTMESANVALYARWTKNKYKLTYDGNGNDGGMVPAEAEYDFGASVTVSANTGILTKANYSFSGWNTAANGTGTNYVVGSTFTIGAGNSILYAKWAINQYAVYFDAQGGTSIATTTVNYGSTVTEPTAPKKNSYTFSGWFKEATCINAWNFVNDKIISPDTLFAKWVIMDRDSNIYTEVKIGTQVWMKENLKTTKYNDGTPIGDYVWYNNDISNKEKYGALYSWTVVDSVNSKKIAPAGWHVPSATEWTILQNYLITNGYNYDNTTSGNKIGKALASTTGWDHSDVVGAVGNSEGTNNRTMFSGMPGGSYYNYTHQDFSGLGQNAIWWSITDVEGTEVAKLTCSISYDSETFVISETVKFNNFSIRLIKD